MGLLMKIVFVAPRFHTNQYEAIRELKARGHSVEFHALLVGPTEDHSLLTPKIFAPCQFSLWLEKILGLGGANHPRWFPNPWHYFRSLIQAKPDIIIIRESGRNFSRLAALVSKLLGIRIIFYDQVPLLKDRNRLSIIKREFFLFALNAALYTPIKGEDINNGEPVKNAYYVPFAVSNNFLDRKSNSELKLLMIGKYHQPRKNHILFIDALTALKEKYAFQATIVGECVNDDQISRFQSINDKIYQIGMQDRIVLKKNIPFSEMGNLYKSHDIFVLPSRDEPAAISILEAIGSGLPAICSNTCGTRFYIINGKNGYVVKTDDLSDLIQKIETLLNNSSHLLKMKEYCRDFYDQEISGSAYVKYLDALMRDRWNIKLE